jgi:glycosyltransferase involved in cell wall biosynthesis
VRVLLINTRHYPGGGDSTYTFNLAALLRARGHETAFFAMRDPRNVPDVNDDLFVSHIDFAALHERRTLAAGVRALRRAIYSGEARRNIARLLDRVRPDIVHAHSVFTHLTPSVFVETSRRGIPLVWTLHDYKLVCPNTHLLIDATSEPCTRCAGGAFYQAMLHRCKKGSFLASALASAEAYAHRALGLERRIDRFLAPSAFLRRTVLAMTAIEPHRITHLPYFVPVEATPAVADPEAYFLFSGRVTAIKGVLHLLKAMRAVPEAHLRLAGRVDPALAEELRGRLLPNVEYVGFREGPELRRLVAGAAAVVVPSLWYENQPFAILEAFAAGRPVIASALGGMAELIGDGERGILVPPKDADALAGAIRTVLTDPGRARRWGENALEYVRRAHDAEDHYERLIAIYRAVIGGRRPP